MDFQQLLIAALMLMVCFLLGTLSLDWLRLKKTIAHALVTGALTALALFQIVAYPLYRLNASFRLLFILYVSLMGALLLLALYRLIRGRGIGGYCVRWRRPSWPQGVLMLMLLAVMAAQVFIALRYTFPTSDDSYYLARSMEAIAQNRLAVTPAEAWLGFESATILHSPDASTWIFLQAVLAKLTGTQVTILSRGGLLLALALLSFAAVWALADRLSEKLNHPLTVKLLTLLFYTLLLMLHSAYIDTAASWVQRYIWQGKSLIPSLVVPGLLLGAFDIVEGASGEKQRKGPWIYIAITLTAGVCVSAVGLFLPAILYFTLGVSYLVAARGKPLRTVLLPALLSVLPVVIFGGLSLVLVNGTTLSVQSGEISMDWLTEFNHSFLSSARFLVLYAAGVIYLCFRRSRTAIILFVGVPVVLFLTFLNPLFIRIVARYVTTVHVYWRLYWLLPLYFVPAFALADAIGRLSAQTARGVLIGALCAVFCLGTVDYYQFGAVGISQQVRDVLNLSPLQRRSNAYALPDSTIAIADLILTDFGERDRRPVLLAPTLGMYQIRQYTCDINLATAIRSENWAELKETMQGTESTAAEFLFALSRGEITDPADLHCGLAYFQADYLCLEQEDAALPGLDGLTFLAAVDGYSVWRYAR